jgi:hypothetical protein
MRVVPRLLSHECTQYARKDYSFLDNGKIECSFKKISYLNILNAKNYQKSKSEPTKVSGLCTSKT